MYESLKSKFLFGSRSRFRGSPPNMGGASSKDKYKEGTENGEAPTVPLTEFRDKKKKKSVKDQKKIRAQVENHSLTEIVEEGKVGSVKAKILSLKEQYGEDTDIAVRHVHSKIRPQNREADINNRLTEELNRLDGEGLSALHYAARDEHPAIAKVLIAAGADPNIKNKKGATPLHAAAKSVHDTESNKEDVITILLKADANVNAQDNNGVTPLHLAAYRDNVVGVQKLLQAENIDIHVTDKQGQTLLHHAAASDADKVISTLTEKLEIKDVKAVDTQGQTALHVACRFAARESFTTLFDIFKESNQDMKKELVRRDKEGNTPFHWAAASGDKNTMDTFVQYFERETRGFGQAITPEPPENEDDWTVETDVENLIDTIKQLCLLKNNQGETPLHLAAQAGTRYNVETILDKTGNTGIDVEDKLERSPLHGAVIYNNTEVVEFLLDRGASIDHVDENWHSTILVAARVSTAGIMEILLRRDPPEYEIRYDTDTDEKNPLHVAAERDDPDLMKVLLKYCHDTDDKWLLDTPDRNNNSPLHIAAEKGKPNNVQALLEFNCEVDLKNADLNTPTHLAAKYGRHQVIEMLSTFDREVLKTGDDDGNTALHIACLQGHERVAKTLIKSGADITAKNHRNQTALFIASKNGHAKICKSLLKAGADPNPPKLSQADIEAGLVPDPIPLHVACKEGHPDLITLLIRFHADVKACDGAGHNCLNIAIMNAQKDAAIAVVRSPVWQDALRNESYELIPRRRRTTPLRQLIEKMPDVAEIVLNQCVDFEDDIDPTTGRSRLKTYEGANILLDFQFLEDEQAPWKKKAIQSKRTRKRHPLKLMADLKRANLLGHPLVVTLLNRKWWQTIWLYMLIFLLYGVYLVFLTGYMLVNHPPFSFDNQDKSISDQCERLRATDLGSKADDFSSLKRRIFIDIGQWVILVISCLSILGELVQFVYRGRKYIRSVENYLDLCSYVLALVLVINTNSCQRETGIRTDIQWQIGAFAMFLSWVNLVLFYKMFPKLGMYVYMFNAITATFLGVLRVFVLYIVAFALTFYVLMQNQVEFSDVWVSIAKTSIMTTGEFEFFDIVHGEEENGPDPAHILHYSVLVRILLLVFASMMAILLMNLLVGLAVGDIQGLQENATVQKLRIQVEQTLDAEYYWLFSFIRHQFQKRLVGSKAKAEDDDYDDLKGVAVIEREEQQQLSLEASRQEVERRMEKHMDKQNKKLSELMEKMDDQERRNEETQRMLRKILRQMNAAKEVEKLPFKLTNNTQGDVKFVLDWGGVLKVMRHTLNPSDRFETVIEDEPQKLYIFHGDTKLEHDFEPDKQNEYTVTLEGTTLKLSDAASGVVCESEVVAFESEIEDEEEDDDDDW